MWFAKEIETETAVAELTPLEQYKQSCKELTELGTEFKAAERELARCFAIRKDPRVCIIRTARGTVQMQTRVNAAKLVSAEVRECERNRTEAFEKYQQKLCESAQLKKAAGLATY